MILNHLGKGGRLSCHDRTAIIKAYEAGWSTYRIRRELGHGRTTTQIVLDAAGVKRRTHRETKQRYAVDETAFDRDTPESRYWVGFVLGDGCLTVGATLGVTLALSAADKTHVESFRRFLGSNHPIAHVRGSGFDQDSVTARLAIASPRLAESLKARGVNRRKTWTASVCPSLANDRDFWRGMIDSDGWLTYYRIRRSAWHVTLGLTGTREVCESFADFVPNAVGRTQRLDRLSIHRNGSVWKVHVNGYQALRLADHLYSDACVALPRKMAKAWEFASIAANL